MANDIASLGIEVKTDSVKQAADDLDKLNESGKSAEEAAGKVGNAWAKAAAKISTDTGQIVRELQQLNSKQDSTARVFQAIATQIESASKSFQSAATSLVKYREESSRVGAAANTAAPAIQKTTEVVQGQSDAFAALESKIDPLISALGRLDFSALGTQISAASTSFQTAAFSIERYREEAGRLNTTLNSVPANTARATSATRQQSDALAELLGRIDPVVGALGRLDTMEESLRGFRASGALGAEDFTIYKAKIDAMRDALDQADGKLRKTGVSAAQTAAALRMLPAQFTDIAVGLQGGQSPFTVLLQQGGQIKDQFGGIGPAFAAVGRYAVGLVNPFTLAAAAVAGLGAAVFASQDDFNALNRALVSTGNVAGKTASQVMALANDIADGRNYAQASEAVLALAKNGQLTGDAFVAAAKAATELSAATGESASDIANKLSSAKGSVTALAVEFNNQYGFMTKATYDQIAALEDQGDRMEAVRVLSGSLAEEMSRRNKEMQESTRGLAAAWDSVANSVRGVWNQLKERLAASKDEFNLQFLQGQLEDAQKIGDKALIAGLQQQVDEAQKKVDAQSKVNEGIAEEVRHRKEIIEADNAWRAAADQYLTKQQKKEKEIAEQRELGLKAGRSEAEIAARIAEVEAKYADKVRTPRPKAEKAYQDDAATRMLQQLKEQEASLDGQLDTSEKLSASRKQQLQFEQLISDLKGKDQLTSDQKSLLANEDSIKAQLAKNVAIEKEIQLRQEAVKVQAYQDSLSNKLQSQQQGYDLQLAGLGAGDKEQQRIKERLRLQQSYQNEVDKLSRQATLGEGNGGISQSQYKKELAAQNDFLQKSIQAQEDYYKQLDDMQSRWDKGVENSLQNYVDNATNYYQQAADAMTSILGSATDALSDGIYDAVTQAESLGDALGNVAAAIGQSIVKALADMAAQWLVVQAVQLVSTKTTQASAAATLSANAQATALQAGLAAFASTAAIPIVGPALAPAAMASALAVAEPMAAAIGAVSLAGAAGFYSGGFTGAGNPTDIAGPVHKGEYVMTAQTVNRLGIDNLDAIQNGRMTATQLPAANDGSVGSQRGIQFAGGNTRNINVSVNGVRDAKDLRRSSAKVARDASRALDRAERFR